MTWQQRYMERFYDPKSGFIDGTVEFHALVERTIPRDGKILEVGPGPAGPTSRLLAKMGELYGLDTDPEALKNESLAHAALLDGDAFPFEDAMFDGCVSDYVIEHVKDAEVHLREVARVLKPGAAYVFRTPNRYHYIAGVSALTPHWFHELVANRLRAQHGRVHDPYPTVYAMNSRASVRRLAGQCGMAVEELRMVEKAPSYGLAARPLFLAFMAYERLVNATDWAADLRSNIFAVLRRS